MGRNNKCQDVSNRCCNVVSDAAQSGGHLREDKPRRCKLTVMRIAIILLSILLLSGCWSQREIEDLSITVAAALDIGNIASEEQEFEKKGADYPRNQRITLTYQVAKPEQSGQEASGSKKKYRNVSLSGDSLYQISREISLKEANPIFGQHYKALVIGSGLAQQLNLRDVLDFFMREQEFRQSCLVYISRGTGKEVLDVNLPGDVPAFRLLGISDNHYRTNRLLKPLSLTNLLEKLNSMISFMIQNVATANGELKLSGASVISGSTGKQLGYLDEEDMEAANWILGGSKGGVLKSKDIITNQVSVYEITNVKSQIIPHVENGRISFDVRVKSDGRLGEQMISNGNDFDNKFIRRLEEDAEKQIKELVTKLLDKLQKKFHADVLGFGDKLRIAYPRLWEQEKKTWDKTFATTPIRYDVNVTIREYGTTNMRARQTEGRD